MDEKEFIQSIEKGLLVLSAFTRDQPAYTLAEMAKRTGLSRAAARRVVLTLHKLGYVGTDGREFYLLPRALEIGYAYLDSFGLGEIARPHLEALNAQVGEACSMGVLSDRDVVYIARSQSRRVMTLSLGIGARLDATATAVGRVLLAALPDDELVDLLSSSPIEQHTPLTITSVDKLVEEIAAVRERGWAVVDQELEIGICTAAAPVRNSDGDVVAAINVAIHTSRIPRGEVEDRILPGALATAAAVEADYASDPRARVG